MVLRLNGVAFQVFSSQLRELGKLAQLRPMRDLVVV